MPVVAYEREALIQPRLGRLMHLHRTRSGISMQEAAARSGVSAGTWCHMENGGDARISTLVAVLAFLESLGL